MACWCLWPVIHTRSMTAQVVPMFQRKCNCSPWTGKKCIIITLIKNDYFLFIHNCYLYYLCQDVISLIGLFVILALKLRNINICVSRQISQLAFFQVVFSWERIAWCEWRLHEVHFCMYHHLQHKQSLNKQLSTDQSEWSLNLTVSPSDSNHTKTQYQYCCKLNLQWHINLLYTVCGKKGPTVFRK